MTNGFAWLVRTVAVIIFVLVAPDVTLGEEFYKGKTIRLLVGFPPGGGHDLYARVIARHLDRHIPGNPNLLVQNMPGAGGLIMANYLYNIAKPDGLSMGTLMRTLLVRQMIGAAEIKFDATKLNWVGNFNEEVTVCYVRSDTGPKTIEEVIDSKTPIPIGGSAPGSIDVDFPKLHNAILGTKFKIVSGYEGTGPVNVAVERGEVSGRCGYAWASMKSVNRDWLKNKFIHVLMQEATRKHADLPDVPLVTDYAKSEDDAKLLRAVYAVQRLGRPYAFPPGVNTDHVKILRRAFSQLFQDSLFLDEARKLRLEIEPVSGDEVEAVIQEVFATPSRILHRLGEILK